MTMSMKGLNSRSDNSSNSKNSRLTSGVSTAGGSKISHCGAPVPSGPTPETFTNDIMRKEKGDGCWSTGKKKKNHRVIIWLTLVILIVIKTRYDQGYVLSMIQSIFTSTSSMKILTKEEYLNIARTEMESIGFLSYKLPTLEELAQEEIIAQQHEQEISSNAMHSSSDDYSELARVLAFCGNRIVYQNGFPIYLGRPTDERLRADPSLLAKYMRAVHAAVAYYDILVVFDTDHTRIKIATALLYSKELSHVSFVLNRLYPKTQGEKLYNRLDYVVDYAPLFNLYAELVPPIDDQAGKMITRPYANMPLEKFTTSTIQYDLLSPTVSEIINDRQPYILVSGSNRRDYSGTILAGTRTGLNIVIADSHPEHYPSIVSSPPKIRIMKTTLVEYNVLLVHALFVVVPAALPQPEPVGIGSLAKVRMAGKVAVAINNTGVENMILHGYDGFLIPDPTADYEEKHGTYQALFQKLQNDTYRRAIEDNIDPLRNTEEVAGKAMIRMAACFARHQQDIRLLHDQPYNHGFTTTAAATMDNSSMTSSSFPSPSSLWTLHHITNCHNQCDRRWCDQWIVNSPTVGVRGKYRNVGDSLNQVGCQTLDRAAMVQVVRNSVTGRVYAAVACS